MIELFVEPFTHPFMQRALLSIVLVGIACGLTGGYVVLRRLALMGDALAHGLLPGLVLAQLLDFSLFAGAAAAALVAALLTARLAGRHDVRDDSAAGVVFTGLFALGILLMSASRSYRDFHSILFGNLLGLAWADVAVFAVVALLVGGTLALFHKELELSSVDPGYARQAGLRPDRLRTLLLVLVAITVAAAIQAVGVLLTSALLVTPAATAALFARTLPALLAAASAIAALAGYGGLAGSYHFDVSPAAATVLLCTIVFGVAWLVRGWAVRGRTDEPPRPPEGAGDACCGNGPAVPGGPSRATPGR